MHSGTVPETFRNTNVDNQGTNEDDSMSDPHPEAGLFRSQTTQNSGQEGGPYTNYFRRFADFLPDPSISHNDFAELLLLILLHIRALLDVFVSLWVVPVV